MWVIGGYNGGEALNDAWSTSDGVQWTRQITLKPYPARYGHTCINCNNAFMLLLGGASSENYNDAWVSGDGKDWTEVPVASNYTARRNHAALLYNDNIYIIGGQNNTNYLDDVWKAGVSISSAINWNRISTSAYPARACHTALVYGGKMWIFGGYDGSKIMNDVWWSTTGAQWTKATDAAAFPPRYLHTSQVFDGKMWVIGGLGSNAELLQDAWCSTDGVSWTEVKPVDEIFTKRQGLASAVLSGRLWIFGGWDLNNTRQNDTWYAFPPVEHTAAGDWLLYR